MVPSDLTFWPFCISFTVFFPSELFFLATGRMSLKKLTKTINFGLESLSNLVKQTPRKRLYDAIRERDQDKVRSLLSFHPHSLLFLPLRPSSCLLVKAIEIYNSVLEQGSSYSEEIDCSRPFYGSSSFRSFSSRPLFFPHSENDESLETPLHLAARYALPHLLGQFLSRGGNPNITTENGETVLHAVCCCPDFNEERLDCLQVRAHLYFTSIVTIVPDPPLYRWFCTGRVPWRTSTDTERKSFFRTRLPIEIRLCTTQLRWAG